MRHTIQCACHWVTVCLITLVIIISYPATPGFALGPSEEEHTLLLVAANAYTAQIKVEDDLAKTISLRTPARRIISLAPHLTEILFRLNAGKYLVGTTEYSDYPLEALQIPRVGSAQYLDIEKIHALHPDLILAWGSGGYGDAAPAIEQLKTLGYPLFISEPTQIETVASTLERLALLVGSPEVGLREATLFRQRYQALRKKYARQKPVRVFYQLWQQPLITIGGPQVISAVMETCGAQNIFSDLMTPSPTVQLEAVIERDPELIIASGPMEQAENWLASWRNWPKLQAVQQANLITFPPDLLDRMGPRLLTGIEKFCAIVEAVRQHQTTPYSISKLKMTRKPVENNEDSVPTRLGEAYASNEADIVSFNLKME